MNVKGNRKAQTSFIVYAMTQSRDDKKLDIASSESETLLSDPTERMQVRKLIEEHAPSPDKNNFSVKTGKDWLAAFLRPDRAIPGQRFRPVLLVANQITWKAINPVVLGDAVKNTMEKLVGPDELSAERMQDFQQKLVSSVKGKIRQTGYIVAACLAAAIVVAVTLFFLFV